MSCPKRPPHQYYPKPVTPAPPKPEIQLAVELVKSGKSLVAAATEARVTEAALRSACYQQNITLTGHTNADRIRRERLKARDTEIARLYHEKEALETISAMTGAAVVTVVRVLRRDLKIEIGAPRRKYKRRQGGSSVRMQRARVAALDLLQRRNQGNMISIALVAREHELDRHAVENAWRQLRREIQLDDSRAVGDTDQERRRT